jgi:hypothetical protein
VASLALVAVGGVVPLVVWCIASPWTFAAALAAGCWACSSAGRTALTRVGRRLRGRLAEVPIVDVRQRELLRLLPAVALAAVGWSMLAGGAGAALLLVDAAFGLPILVLERRGRWPDGRDVGHIPDTVEELASHRTSWEETSSAPPTVPSTDSSPMSSPVPISWPGPRTLLPDLDDGELQHAWDSSTRALNLGPAPAALLRIVAARARYLDALDERDPDGLAGRLAMGKRDHWTSFDSPT